MKRFLSIIIAILVISTCVFTLSACKEEPDEVHDYNVSTYFVENGKAYKGKKCDCGKYLKEQELVGAKIATPQNFKTTIESAEENSTIVLTSGNYNTLRLVGKNSYPQGLTIIGTEDVAIWGLSISSGIKYENINSSNKSELNQDLVEQATLNGNLTFKSLSFCATVSIKNASIDGFSLIDCQFKNNSGLLIDCNLFCDTYGNDTVSGNKINKYREDWCALYTKNVMIENCSFKSVDFTTDDDTAIKILSVENLTIKNCQIDGAEYNALQMSTHNSHKNKGTILLEANVFKNTESRLIRLASFEAGSTFILKNNVLENTGNYYAEGEGILKASGVNGVNFEFVGNTYDGEPIDRYSFGIYGIPEID